MKSLYVRKFYNNYILYIFTHFHYFTVHKTVSIFNTNSLYKQTSNNLINIFIKLISILQFITTIKPYYLFITHI